MKITINIDDKIQETEIQINCNQLTYEIENLIATLRILNQQVLVSKENENFLLDVNEISYIEAVDRKTFVYTEADIYESKLKLYEMEEKLCQSGFIRISKSCLVRLKYVKSIRNARPASLLSREKGKCLIFLNFRFTHGEITPIKSNKSLSKKALRALELLLSGRATH